MTDSESLVFSPNGKGGWFYNRSMCDDMKPVVKDVPAV